MGGAEGVPHHDVGAVDVLVGRYEGGEAGAARVLVHEVPGRVAVGWVVGGDPEVVGGETGPGGQRGGRVGEEHRGRLGVEGVAGRVAEAVLAFGADDAPDPAAGAVGAAARLRLAGQPG